MRKFLIVAAVLLAILGFVLLSAGTVLAILKFAYARQHDYTTITNPFNPHESTRVMTNPFVSRSVFGDWSLVVLFFALIWVGLTILTIAGMWKVFSKGGQPGWAVLIPIYNFYVLLKVAGKPGWWLILMLIPLVGFVIWIMAMAALAGRFGKGGGFAVGLIFLPYIFYPILGFGSAQYMPLPPSLERRKFRGFGASVD